MGHKPPDSQPNPAIRYLYGNFLKFSLKLTISIFCQNPVICGSSFVPRHSRKGAG